MTEAKKVTPSGDTPRRMADAVNQHSDLINTCFLQPRTLGQLSTEVHEVGRQFLCLDESGGVVPVFSDGISWRRCTDRAVVS